MIFRNFSFSFALTVPDEPASLSDDTLVVCVCVFACPIVCFCYEPISSSSSGSSSSSSSGGGSSSGLMWTGTRDN